MRVYPLIGLKSLKLAEAGGAWRIFTLAKHLAGIFDHVKREDVISRALELGIREVTVKRWIDSARNYNLFVDVQRKSGEWMFILPSNKNAATFLNSTLGNPVELPEELLFSKDWRGYVFAAWQAQVTKNGTKLVSQNKQAELSGVDRQAQRKYNKQAGVTSQKNYAVSNIHANGYSGVLEFGNRACLFQYWDKATHQKKLGWRIPDSRVFPLFGNDFSHSTPRKMSIFNRTPGQYSETVKTIRKLSAEDKETPKEIYTFDKLSEKGNCLWIHQPI